MAAKPHVVALTKIDLVPTDAGLPSIVAPDARAAFAISSVAQRGIDRLNEVLWKLVADAPPPEGPGDDPLP